MDTSKLAWSSNWYWYLGILLVGFLMTRPWEWEIIYKRRVGVIKWLKRLIVWTAFFAVNYLLWPDGPVNDGESLPAVIVLVLAGVLAGIVGLALWSKKDTTDESQTQSPVPR